MTTIKPMTIWEDTFWAVKDRARNQILVTMEGTPKLYFRRDVGEKVLDCFCRDNGKMRDNYELVPVRLVRAHPARDAERDRG